jgi:hypothetical protein
MPSGCQPQCRLLCAEKVCGAKLRLCVRASARTGVGTSAVESPRIHRKTRRPEGRRRGRSPGPTGLIRKVSGIGMPSCLTKRTGVGRRERLPHKTKCSFLPAWADLESGPRELGPAFTERTLVLQNELIRLCTGRSRQAKPPVAPVYKTNYATAVMVFSFASTGWRRDWSFRSWLRLTWKFFVIFCS